MSHEANDLALLAPIRFLEIAVLIRVFDTGSALIVVVFRFFPVVDIVVVDIVFVIIAFCAAIRTTQITVTR